MVQTVFYILACIVAIMLIVAVPVLTLRALVLMDRLENTRRDLAELIAESGLSLHHVNRLLARTQEGVDRTLHTMTRIEKVLALLQPAAAVGSIISGAKRAVTGRRPAAERLEQPEHEGEST